MYNTDLETLKKEVEIETFKSSGPGGQRKNKRETAVRITHLPTGITAVGNESSQIKSKKAAFETLLKRLEEHFRPEIPRIPTKVPRSAKEGRLERKKVHAEKKQWRRRPILE